LPEQWVNAWHSTNTLLPMTMHVGELLSHDEAAPQPGKNIVRRSPR